MPSKGVKFSPSKHRIAKLSQNPRTAATRQWERNMSGLTLALHRADKAATVARSRAIKNLEKASDWGTLSVDTQNERKNSAVGEVNRKRDVKKKALRDEWIAKHGDDQEEEDKSLDVSSSDLELEEDKSLAVPSSESSSEDGVNDEENMSEGAEEVDGEDEGGDLSKDDIASIGDMLATIRARQYAEHVAMVAEMEAEGEQMRGKETPDDYEFGFID